MAVTDVQNPFERERLDARIRRARQSRRVRDGRAVVRRVVAFRTIGHRAEIFEIFFTELSRLIGRVDLAVEAALNPWPDEQRLPLNLGQLSGFAEPLDDRRLRDDLLYALGLLR